MIGLEVHEHAECESCGFSPAIRITASRESESGSGRQSHGMSLCTMCLTKLVSEVVGLQARALARVSPEMFGLEAPAGRTMQPLPTRPLIEEVLKDAVVVTPPRWIDCDHKGHLGVSEGAWFLKCRRCGGEWKAKIDEGGESGLVPSSD